MDARDGQDIRKAAAGDRRAVGNDIVWLADPRNAGRHTDLLLVKRVLTPAERLLVQVSPDPDRMLWSLWAAKEAAFKAFSQGHPGAAFSPISFEVIPEPARNSATVRSGAWSVPVSWKQGPDWVHALAAGDPGTVVWAVERSPEAEDADREAESSQVRLLALRRLAEAGMGGGAIEGRPPRYVVGGADSGVVLSLSHDGPWLAAAFRLP